MALDGLARTLEVLANGGSVPASRLTKSTIDELRPLLECDAIRWGRRGAGRRLEVQHLAAVERFIAIRFPSGTGGTRAVDLAPKAAAVANFADAHRGVADKSIVLVRAFEGLRADCNGVAVSLAALTQQAGVAGLLLGAGRRWHMTGVLGLVENLELFLESGPRDFGEQLDGYLYYGGRIPRRVLAWLAAEEMSECTLLHLPDYDPVGLDSYLATTTACPGRVRLYVPSDLKQLAHRYGKATLLTDSPAVWRRVCSSREPSVRGVVDVLNEVTKGLEQEALRIHRAELGPTATEA